MDFGAQGFMKELCEAYLVTVCVCIYIYFFKEVI